MTAEMWIILMGGLTVFYVVWNRKRFSEDKACPAEYCLAGLLVFLALIPVFDLKHRVDEANSDLARIQELKRFRRLHPSVRAFETWEKRGEE